ncbi:16S rRNA (cytosine(1402)-N(4))-methyltransferase [Celeribacter ethanolicus]|uniref:Ribosomal RNA small subunit methyltransferase H n=1 Tax=Celeribacter ethanolicus TaxID=1758178 RepID=A0A291G7V0_9RHOB|nr:16S rRNA (cytosine(1402)-N(4))-methyltransferase RsmH [Celeribacter ethanolicus]ATG46100.1 16S rRNA (cytosine(1402)-N(4))-methyltransferase [Celeribacter ethanolicus]TNE69063.1 MAG: 16S rRNA (cytosine(1402)-N(4))-methyltransferase RsmH [Paracoccaceae bacterium]
MASDEKKPHIPVLLNPLLRECAPISGRWLDGTFGAGGYTKGLIAEGADHVTGVDRDPLAHEMAATWINEPPYAGKIDLVLGTFGEMDQYASGLDGVVLDLGVSSMQLDLPERGFSFMKDGPLDMRMSQDGPTAADFVNTADEAEIAEVLFHYGEEKQSRKIARAIVKDRVEKAPFTTTLQLANLIERLLPRKKPGQSHPATRSFQAIRIAVNDEFGQLIEGLEAAERALKPGGQLAVVSFHSLEDRVVKRFFQERASTGGGGSRYAPEQEVKTPGFEQLSKAIGPDADELDINPRARSARLRVGRRTTAPAVPVDRAAMGLPKPVLRSVS